MSDIAIQSRAHVRNKGYAAALNGQSIESHNMNPGSAAIADWNIGFQEGQASLPRIHPTAQIGARIDQSQGGAA